MLSLLLTPLDNLAPAAAKVYSVQTKITIGKLKERGVDSYIPMEKLMAQIAGTNATKSLSSDFTASFLGPHSVDFNAIIIWSSRL